MKRQSLYPGALDSNLNWGSQEGLEVDRQPEDRFTSDSWDLMEDAILELERQGMGFAHSIWDTNLDTGIDTEQAANEDIIRFFTGAPKTERATIDGDTLNVAEYITHLTAADTNTNIRFRNDQISVMVGGFDMIDITEAGAASTFFINNAENNVDFRIAATGATDAFFVQGSDGKIGIGTATVPHGGVGIALLALEAVGGGVGGPHVQFTTDVDDYPLMQFLMLAHDNVNIVFDAYLDGGAIWKSSDADSNYAIIKASDKLSLKYDSGVAANGIAVVTWNDGIVLDTTGLVTHPGFTILGTGNIEIKVKKLLLRVWSSYI